MGFNAKDAVIEESVNRMSNYLEKLSFENERLEQELKEKKIKRLKRQAEELEYQSQHKSYFIQSIAYDHKSHLQGNLQNDINLATKKINEISADMSEVKNDLSGLLNDLLLFKKARNQLETKFLSQQ